MTKSIVVTWICDECGRQHVRSDDDPIFGNPGTWTTLTWGEHKKVDFCGPVCQMRWLEQREQEAAA